MSTISVTEFYKRKRPGRHLLDTDRAQGRVDVHFMGIAELSWIAVPKDDMEVFVDGGAPM